MRTLNSSIVASLVIVAATYACSDHQETNEPGSGAAGMSDAGAAGETSESGSGGAGADDTAGAAGVNEGGSDSVAHAGDSAGGASGESGNRGESGNSGNAGAGGESQPNLSGIRLRFIGAPQIHGTSSEAELVDLIASETGFAPTRIHNSAGAPALVAADLADADVAVIESLLRDYSVLEATLVADWVAAGHGLIVLNGFTTDSTRAGTFASSYAVSFGAIIQQTTPAYVSTFVAHPLTASVSSLYFFGGFPMTTTDPAAVPFASIASATVGLALAHGNGRVALWGDDWIVLSEEVTRVDSQGGRPTAAFWKNALSWTTKRD
ncbi:MAG: hypothetical protein WDO69_12605 [Pseudomonadota bacterium]